MPLFARCVCRILLIACAGGVAGCSAVGYGIGALIDAGNRTAVTPVTFASDPKRENKSVTLRLRTGDELVGTLRGLVRRSDDDYLASYEYACQVLQSDAPLPPLGDTVGVALVSGAHSDAVLTGWDYDGIHVRSLRGDTAFTVPLDSLMHLTAGRARSLGGSELRDLVAAGRVALLTGVALEVRGDGRSPVLEFVPLERIEVVEWKSNGGRKTGLIVGGLLDMTALVATIACAASDCLDFNMTWN